MSDLVMIIYYVLLQWQAYKCSYPLSRCLLVQAQDALLQLHWDPEILQLEYCAPVLDGNYQLLFAGPRVRMGMYEDVPLRIQPHTSSGRADYFGMLVNR